MIRRKNQKITGEVEGVEVGNGDIHLRSEDIVSGETQTDLFEFFKRHDLHVGDFGLHGVDKVIVDDQHSVVGESGVQNGISNSRDIVKVEGDLYLVYRHFQKIREGTGHGLRPFIANAADDPLVTILTDHFFDIPHKVGVNTTAETFISSDGDDELGPLFVDGFELGGPENAIWILGHNSGHHVDTEIPTVHQSVHICPHFGGSNHLHCFGDLRDVAHCFHSDLQGLFVGAEVEFGCSSEKS